MTTRTELLLLLIARVDLVLASPWRRRLDALSAPKKLLQVLVQNPPTGATTPLLGHVGFWKQAFDRATAT